MTVLDPMSGKGGNQFMPLPQQLPPGVGGTLGGGQGPQQLPAQGLQQPIGSKGGGGGIFGGKGGEGGETPQPEAAPPQPPPPVQFSAYKSPEEMAQGRSQFKALERGDPARPGLKQEFQGRRRETRAGSPFQNPQREAVRQMAPGADKRQARKDFRRDRRAQRGQAPRPGLG